MEMGGRGGGRRERREGLMDEERSATTAPAGGGGHARIRTPRGLFLAFLICPGSSMLRLTRLCPRSLCPPHLHLLHPAPRRRIAAMASEPVNLHKDTLTGELISKTCVPVRQIQSICFFYAQRPRDRSHLRCDRAASSSVAKSSAKKTRRRPPPPPMLRLQPPRPRLPRTRT